MRILWGVVLIVVGTLLALQTFGVLPVALPFWPIVWTIVGTYLVVDSLRPMFRRGPSWIKLTLGLWIGAIGVADLLHTNGIITITGDDVWRLGWFVLLIGAGLALIFGEKRRTSSKHCSRINGMGDLHFGREPWVLNRDLSIGHGMGDVRVDLTTAEITEGRHRVNVKVGMGEVVVLVPDNCHVRARASAGMGEVEIFGEGRDGVGVTLEKDVDVPDAASTLEIDARIRIGTVSIRRVPARR